MTIATIALAVIGGLVILFFLILFIMSLPGLFRYIRISKM